MTRYLPFILLTSFFMALSAILYFLHYTIFQDIHHIFIYMIGDLAFLPLEVFLVVIVIERILTRREKRAIMQKLNMVVGAFFSEVGTELLETLLDCYVNRSEIIQRLAIKPNWSRDDFKKAMLFTKTLETRPSCLRIDLEGLKTYLIQKRPFLLRLLENPNLLEHELFTDLLWATFHLTEELAARASLDDLPDADFEHISGDIERMYGNLATEWVSYAEHLQSNYPYLFSLVTRTHPFQERPSAVVG